MHHPVLLPRGLRAYLQPPLLALETTGLPRAHQRLSAEERGDALPAPQPSCSPGGESLWKVRIPVKEEFGSKAYKRLPVLPPRLRVGCNEEPKMGCTVLGGTRDSLQ